MHVIPYLFCILNDESKTTARLNYAVFKKKINPFEAVNRKNKF